MTPAEDHENTPTLFHIIGGEARLRELVDRFYDLMDLEPQFAALRAMHPSTLDGSRDKLFWFLSGWSGGPNHYIERYGHPRLRALGATRRQLSTAQWIEFALVGGLAGLLAATGAAATGWALAEYVFNFEWRFSPVVWLAGVAVGAACAFIGGWVGLRNVLRHPPLQTLREA